MCLIWSYLGLGTPFLDASWAPQTQTYQAITVARQIPFQPNSKFVPSIFILLILNPFVIIPRTFVQTAKQPVTDDDPKCNAL